MSTPVQLSISATSFTAEDPGSWQPLFNTVQAADEAGVDRIVVSDHIVMGENLEEYGRAEIGGQEGGSQPTGPDGHWLEPFTTLSVFAGMTKRIRLGTYILLAALRRPAVFAKQTATLDVLSGGRLDLGVGVGWQREEYEACGLSFEGRGRLLDHTLEVCQTLWREQRAEYDSPELHFEATHMMPKPLQPGGVPIWVSGTINPRVVRRVARFGSGWIPWGAAAYDPVKGLAEMKERVAELGRDASDLQCINFLMPVRKDDGSLDIERTMEPVPAMAEGGITDLRGIFSIPSERSAAIDYLSPIVEAFRAAAGRTD